MIIEDIKERIRIEEEIGREVKLSRHGNIYRGICPFHSEKTPSFTVFPDSGRWKCFGCGQSGDLFDFVMKRNGFTMQEAIRDLAKVAGIEIKPLSIEEQRQIERQRDGEAILAVAADFLHQNMGLGRDGQVEAGSDGLAYARQRGFTDSTIRASGLGWFGKDWNQLRDALFKAGVELEAPAAVALLGYRGNVQDWGERWGVEVLPEWVKDGKIPAIVPGVLIYPHIQGGRVRYLSARIINPDPEKNVKSWNLREALLGAKQLYFNSLWGKVRPEKQEGQAESKYPFSAIVEGQACAVTLAQWGIPAAALAGCSLNGKVDANHPLMVQLKRQLTLTGGQVVLGLDNDRGGREGTAELAAALMRVLELRSTQIRLIPWVDGESDWNAWLQNGGTAELALKRMEKAPTWLNLLVEKATPKDGGDADEDDVREVFAAMAALEVYDIARMRETISKALNIKRSVFDALLKAARQEAGLSDDGKPKYQIVGGKITHRYYDRLGNEVFAPLCNFSASIASEVIHDDGDVQERRFTIEGALSNGMKLPQATVPASEFSAMSWIISEWGARAVVEAGGSTKDHLRAAIQNLSGSVTTNYIYGHLGWRTVEGKQIYLSSGGAVGNPAVHVDLTTDLMRYKLPQSVTAEQVKAGMIASLKMLEVGNPVATIPLWAAMYLAPLSSIIPPAFTIWIFGTTGTMKSTITALAMSHYGTFGTKTPTASWTGTANALEKKAFLVKDAPLWIDDYVPQSTPSGNNELKAKVDQLLRDWGNRAGRSRMQSNLKLRQTYAPRGLIISTAEQLPPGESIQARLYQIELHPGDLTGGTDSNLTRAQNDEAPLYPQAMTGYLEWISEQWNSLTRDLPERLIAYTDAARQNGSHLRMPANVGHLFTGFEMGLNFALACDAITQARYEELRALGWSTLMEIGQKQVIEAAEEKPVDMFLRALEELLAQGSIYLRSANTPDKPEMDLPISNRRSINSEFLGWYDDLYWYLFPGPSYKTVVQYYRSSGVVFPDSERGVKVKLKEQKLLHANEGDPYRYQMTIEGRPRVWRILRNQNTN